MLSPQANPTLLGHSDAEAEFVANAKTGRLHHAWLISGPKGIGKATLGFRMARKILADTAFDDLDMDASTPLFQRITQGSHGDLIVFGHGESKDIKVDEIRDLGSFLSLTPSESSWRVALIDAADYLNPQAANALLKLLEEPPQKTLLILIHHGTTPLLPTIRSRCRLLRLGKVSADVMDTIIAPHIEARGEALSFALQLAEGRPGLALLLYTHESLYLYEDILALLSDPFTPATLLAFAEKYGAKARGEEGWEVLHHVMQYFIRAMVEHFTILPNPSLAAAATQTKLEDWLELWEKWNRLQHEVDVLNQDRKLALLTFFHTIRS